MTELEKILAGGLYDFSDAELAEQFREGRRRVERFNRTPVDDAAAYAAALGALIPGIPASAKVVQPFYCDLGWRIELGEEVFVNMGCTFLDCGGVRIGARTKLGPNCQLYTPQHPVDYLDRRRPVETSFRITIGEDCWLGGGVVVCPGVTIGDGAIVAAYSVVTKDVEPYSVVGGNPAHFIKKRFDDELISLLLQWKWWDLEGDELFENLSILVNPDLGNVRLQIRALLAK